MHVKDQALSTYLSTYYNLFDIRLDIYNKHFYIFILR